MLEISPSESIFSQGSEGAAAPRPLPERIIYEFLKNDYRQAMFLIDWMRPQDSLWQGRDQNTVLHWAVCHDETQATLKMLRRTPPNALILKNALGETPLGTAIWRANPVVIAALIKSMPPEAVDNERVASLSRLEEEKKRLEAYPRLSPDEKERIEQLNQCIALFGPARSFKERLCGALGCKV